MYPAPRARLAVMFLSSATILIGGAPVFAQSQPAPTPAVQTQTTPSARKPVHKLNEVPTDDSLVLLAVRRTPAESAKPVPAVAAQDANASATNTEKQAAEIASLQKQIQDKIKRITFLMRLFVSDERPFLNDPSNPQVDPDSQERRKYSQDELLYETAELARLKARLNQLTAAR
jgi:hypothetical protein